MTVNHGVLGSSPSWGAIRLVGETVNSHAFHACTRGFESRTSHHESSNTSVSDVFFLFIRDFREKSSRAVDTAVGVSYDNSGEANICRIHT